MQRQRQSLCVCVCARVRACTRLVVVVVGWAGMETMGALGRKVRREGYSEEEGGGRVRV